MTAAEKPHIGILSDSELEWLRRQDKAMLVEIIDQIAANAFAFRGLVDDAILQAYRNRLHQQIQEAQAVTDTKQGVLQAAIRLGAGFHVALPALDAAERAERQISSKFTSSWQLKPGFHRKDKP